MDSQQPIFDFAIAGGGPAGVTTGYFLREAGVRSQIILEKEKRIGGKSETVHPYPGTAEDLGTCFITTRYILIRSLMRKFGLREFKMKEDSFIGTGTSDGPLVFILSYVAGGKPKIAVWWQIFKYIVLWIYFKRLIPSFWVERSTSLRRMMAASSDQWLDSQGLDCVKRLFTCSHTFMLYGRLRDVPVHYLLTWNTPLYLLGAMFRDLTLPQDGYQKLWEKAAADLDVRTGEKISSIDKNSHGIFEIRTAAGSLTLAKQLVVAIPLHDFLAIKCNFDTTPYREIAEVTKTHKVVSAVCFAKGMAKIPGRYYCLDYVDKDDGSVLALRRQPRITYSQDGDETEQQFMVYYYGGGNPSMDYDSHTLRSLEKLGGRECRITEKRVWDYAPMWTGDSILNNIQKKCRDIQGKNGIWLTGSHQSFESVIDVALFNKTLVKRIVKTASFSTER